MLRCRGVWGGGGAPGGGEASEGAVWEGRAWGWMARPRKLLGLGCMGGGVPEEEWWVDAQAHLSTATKNSAVCWPPLGTSTTQPPQEVQAAAAE